MKKYSLLFVIVMSMFSCLDKYPAPIRSETSKLVVDGAISTSKPPYQIKLTYSGVFDYAFQTQANQVEPNAIITVSDKTGRSTGFKYLGAGIYQSTDLTFRGVVGQSYTMLIKLPNGQQYASFPEKMPTPVPVENIYGEFKKKELEQTDYYYISDYNPNIPPRYPTFGAISYAAEPNGPSGYQIFIDTKDPGNEANYYRWTAQSVTRRETTGVCGPFCNCTCIVGESCFLPLKHIDLNITTDALINGNTIKRRPLFFSSVFATGNIYIEVDQISMTREAYQFWKRYQEQLERTGTILDPLPSPIEGNVYNVNNPSDLALGYFAASGIFKKRVIIPVQALEFDLLPRGVTRRRGTCMSVYGPEGAYDVGQWPNPNWGTEVLN
jgi:hypothetical protein